MGWECCVLVRRGERSFPSTHKLEQLFVNLLVCPFNNFPQIFIGNLR